MPQPLLSIVIPTRNRQLYCIAAIENILSHDYPGLELCIHDNSDDDRIEQYLQTRAYDSRLVYKRIPDRLNSLINMDRSIGMATGKYVCMIGDDDTVMPNIFETVEWMDDQNVDSVCSHQRILYFWPGATSEDPAGLLRIIDPPRKKMLDRPIGRKLDRLFRQGITRFKIYRLPQVYHGIILRRRLEEIKQKTGHFFGGLSPDIYSTLALCSVVERHVIVDKAISVAGACTGSATAQNANQGHRGELSEAPHLELRGEYIWDNYIPAYYSVETIWAESAMKAVNEMGRTDLRKKFNYGYLVAFAALNNRNILRLALRKSLAKENYFVANDSLCKIKVAFNAGKVVSAFGIRKLRQKLRLEDDRVTTCRGVANIAEAVRRYTEIGASATPGIQS